MLPEKLADTLKAKQAELLAAGKLPTPEELESYYTRFRERFGIERLMRLEGEELLILMHSLGPARDSLVYWLDFKNDAEFPPIFGTIGGGSALKYGVYQSKDTGIWMSRDASNYPAEITVEQAVEIATRHRDQLKRGADLLDRLPVNASDDAYRALQQNMNEHAPDVSNTSWGHKYFSLLYPDKLVSLHNTYYQRFHLVKLLQPNIADERDGRYVMSGRFVALARELDMPMNHLVNVLISHHSKAYRYFSVLADETQQESQLTWDMQRDGGYAAIMWPELGDLSDLKHDSPSKQRLRKLIKDAYPHTAANVQQGIFNFTTDMAVGDVIVAFDKQARQVVGVGRVTSAYYYEPASSAPHRLKVDWLPSQPWPFPADEAFEKAGKEIFLYANQVEIERHLLDTPITRGLVSVPAPVVSETIDILGHLEPKTSSETETSRLPKLFISYRRKSWPFTHRLADELAKILHADIFVDFSGIDETDFEHSILRNLAESDAVLLVISEYTFEDRIHHDDDWVRREIREALRQKKPIVPISVDGQIAPQGLPDDIRDITRSQVIKFYPEYFSAAVEQLADFILKIGVIEVETQAHISPSPSTFQATPKRRDRPVRLDDALAAMDEGDFAKAVFLLESLLASGYRSNYINIDDLLAQARKQHEAHQAKQDYDEIVALAARKVFFEQARQAFLKWCDDHPTLIELLDTEDLRGRFQ